MRLLPVLLLLPDRSRRRGAWAEACRTAVTKPHGKQVGKTLEPRWWAQADRLQNRFQSPKSGIGICGRSGSRQSRDRLESFNEKNRERWVVTSKQRVYMVVGTVGRQRFTSEPADIPDLRHDRVVRSGGFFKMRGMLPPSEARMRMCVMQVGKRGRWTYRDWIRWRFLWKFFPWYARELRYRGDFCIGAGCMHWFWEDSDKKERGYCSVAVSRTQNMMWAKEMDDERGKQAARLAKP